MRKVINKTWTALQRARCKYCASPPVRFYYLHTNTAFKDHSSRRDILDFVQRYKKRVWNHKSNYNDPCEVKYINFTHYKISYNNFNARLHRINSFNKLNNDKIAFICLCGKSWWMLCDKN
jgi:hypothetical protein